MLKFSPANAKLKALQLVPELQPYLQNKRKVYSYDSGLSGWTCPGAKDCLAKVQVVDGKRKVVDGPDAVIRCFSASQEALFTNVFNQRKANYDFLKQFRDSRTMSQAIADCMPKNLGILRLNVAGDIFSQVYFDAVIMLAANHPDRLFYAYTKSLHFWSRRIDDIPDNLIMTASWGGRYDHLIKENNFRSAIVVNYIADADKLGLTIDHTDEWAANPSLKNRDFALLIHGPQAAGSEAGKAIQTMKKENVKFSYPRA